MRNMINPLSAGYINIDAPVDFFLILLNCRKLSPKSLAKISSPSFLFFLGVFVRKKSFDLRAFFEKDGKNPFFPACGRFWSNMAVFFHQRG